MSSEIINAQRISKLKEGFKYPSQVIKGYVIHLNADGRQGYLTDINNKRIPISHAAPDLDLRQQVTDEFFHLKKSLGFIEEIPGSRVG